MRNLKHGTISFLAALIAVSVLSFFAKAEAATPKVTFAPKKFGPGDLVVVTVSNVTGTVEGTFEGKTVYFNPAKKAYKAMLGIDLNAEPGERTLELSINGTKSSRPVKIAKKKYPVQKLTLPENMVVLSPENEARVEREQQKVALLWPIDSFRFWDGNFMNPLPGKKIGTPFGVRRIINNIPKSPHTGVDVTADEGEPVHAPNSGVVVLVDNLFYSGNSVVLDHGQGIYTMFFHLSKATVKYGQAVSKGDVIGLVGMTGRATGAHLHWGARVQGAKVDPLELIHLKLE